MPYDWKLHIDLLVKMFPTISYGSVQVIVAILWVILKAFSCRDWSRNCWWIKGRGHKNIVKFTFRRYFLLQFIQRSEIVLAVAKCQKENFNYLIIESLVIKCWIAFIIFVANNKKYFVSYFDEVSFADVIWHKCQNQERAMKRYNILPT